MSGDAERRVAVTGICRDDGGYGLGIAVADVAGYWPFRERLRFASYADACREARRINSTLGLTEAEAVAVILSSMRASNAGCVSQMPRNRHQHVDPS